jgi:hypothetical protein
MLSRWRWMIVVIGSSALSACGGGNSSDGGDGDADADADADAIDPPTESATAYCAYVVRECEGRAPECAGAYGDGERIVEGVPGCEDEWRAVLECGGIECGDRDGSLRLNGTCEVQFAVFQDCAREYCDAQPFAPECGLF